MLDRLLLLALEDAADRTFRLHAGAPAPFVTQVLCAELEVDGFLAHGEGLQLSDDLGRAVAAAAASIAAGRRPVPERAGPAAVPPVRQARPGTGSAQHGAVDLDRPVGDGVPGEVLLGPLAGRPAPSPGPGPGRPSPR